MHFLLFRHRHIVFQERIVMILQRTGEGVILHQQFFHQIEFVELFDNFFHLSFTLTPVQLEELKNDRFLYFLQTMAAN